MNFKKHSFSLIAACLWGNLAADNNVVINEIMQSNIDCIMDDLNDFPDSWVELYNAGTETVNLADFSLGTTNSAADATQLPAFNLEPQKYAIVYCDKAKDDWETYKAPKKRDKFNWHMPFRLESGKDCKLFLFKNGKVVDQLPSGMKKQPAPNVAYGRKTDGASKWDYQLTPTPGAQNTGETCSNKDILDVPVFSVPGKVFKSESLSLTLSIPDGSPEGTEIRYTLDGSEPTQNSALFTKPIEIKNQSTIVRAKLFCKGKLSPRSLTQSYLKIDHDVTLPVFSIVTDDRYLNDPQIGIYVDGKYSYDGSDESKNFFYNWRRPMNFEYFEGEGVESAINQLGEGRITGGYTRRNSLKSLGLYANKRFGEKRLAYEFFPDQRPGSKAFKSIMLRDAGNDYDGLYMRDAIIQCSMAKYIDMDWQAWHPAIIFINGEYRGMLNIRERSNEDNIYSNYNGLEDIDMTENWSELKEGRLEAWQEFKDFYGQSGHSYAEYDKIMDVQEFMDVMIINSVFCNCDFPGNNIVWWRPQADGGRWRVLVKDTDFGLGLYGKSVDTNYFYWLDHPSESQNSASGTRLYRRLMEDQDFKREFIDRCAIYMGDFINLDRVWETWEPMYLMTKYEYPHHRALINPWWPNYDQELNSAKNWLKQRPAKVYQHLSSYFKVGAVKNFVIKKNDEDITVSFNGVKLSRGTFDGKFFAQRQIILEGENLSGWEIAETTSSGTTKNIVKGNRLEYSIPSACSSVTVTAYKGEVNPGDDPNVDPSDKNILVNGGADKDFDQTIAYNDMERNFTVCAWGKTNAGAPHPADIEKVDGDRVFVVHATDCPNPEEGASAWDNQFWIQAPCEFHAGDQFKVSFRYKASQEANTNTQVHHQTPSQYLHWEGIGDVRFTTEWQTFEGEVTVSDQQDGMWSIAFNLNAEIKVATDFFFDDLRWEFEGVCTGISLDPEKETLYVGETLQLTVLPIPNATDFGTVSWNSSSDCITINDEGFITAVSSGAAIVTATTNAGFTATCEITVKSDVEPEDPTNILTNGSATNFFDQTIAYNDMERNFTVCAWGKTNAGAPHPADIEKIDGERVFVVHTADCPNPEDGASAWDNQFWIQAPQEFYAEDIVKISFRYKAAQDARTSTQVHRQSPGSYLHWEGLGDVWFTTEWQTYESEIHLTDRHEGMWSFAFNLSEEVKVANDFYFDDLRWEIIKSGKEPVCTGISISPEQDIIYVGENLQLTVNPIPEGTDFGTVTWKSSHRCVKIDENGLVVGRSSGTATITATTDEGFTATCEIIVKSNKEPEDPANILTNGTATNFFDQTIEYNDMERNFTVCAWGKTNASAPHPADVEKVDGERVFVVHATDCTNPEDDASAWDNQFWIQAPREFHAGDKFKVSFRYKASQEANTNTQVHHQTPSQYLHWYAIGDIRFDTEWKTFEGEVTVNDQQDGMWSIAFNLNSEVKVATDFYFDDLRWEIISIADGIQEIFNDDAFIPTYNLQGQRVDNRYYRGIIIRNGKIIRNE